MAWAAIIPAVAGLIGGAMSDKSQSDDAKMSNNWLKKPTQTTAAQDPWAGSADWLNASIANFGNEAFHNWKPSYYGKAPPKFGGGGGANYMNQGMDQWINGEGSLGSSMSDFISSGMGQGNKYLNSAFDETMNYSPDMLNQMAGSLGSAGENPYIHQFINEGFGFDPSSIMGMAGQFANSFGGGFGGGGGGGGGGGAPRDLGKTTNQWMQDTLDGKWLNESNPHLQKLIEDFNYQTSEGYKTLEVPQLDSEYIRAGRYGSNAYATGQAMAAEKAQRAIAGNTAGILAGNYEAERGRMNDQQGMLNQLDMQRYQSASQEYAANAAAGASAFGSRMGAMSSMFGDSLGALTGLTLGNQGNLLEAILGYGDQRLQGSQMGLDAAGMATEADLARLGLLRDNAANSMDYDVGLLGAGNDLLGTTMDAYAQGGALRNQGAGARYASDMQRWQYEQSKHDYYRDAELDHWANVMNQMMGPSTAFGTNKTWGVGPGVANGAMQSGGSGTNWLSGLMGGLMTGAAMGGYGGQRGGNVGPTASFPGMQPTTPLYNMPGINYGPIGGG